MAVGRLTDVILSSDPTGRNEWTATTGRICDVDKVPEGESEWQVRVNRGLVGPGTVGWIHRWTERGRLAAVIVFTGEPYSVQEAGGEVHYCDGELRRLRPSVATATVRSDPGWTNKAPYTTNRAVKYKDGVRLLDQEVSVLTGLLGQEDSDWLAQARRLVTAGLHASGSVGVHRATA